MKKTDMICAGILVLSAIGHAFGSYIAYKSDPMTLLWALSASFAVLLLAAINLLRANRHGDRSLSWTCFFGNLAWLAACITLARLLGNPFDIRADLQGVAVLALTGFSVKSALSARPARA
jgi:hypothetical protein